jgi:Rps23 Pro-64 3,4-dihydroxylase Tpa1-like proline 4-hydroxylase
MDYTVPAPGIMLFTNVWDDAKKLIEDIEKTTQDPSKVILWKRALVGGSKKDTLRVSGEKSGVRSNSTLYLDSNWANTENEIMKFAGNLCKKIVSKVDENFNVYKNNFYPSSNPVPDQMIILKYQTGQEYKQHADAGGGNNRIVSMVSYINDDYEGGNIEFPYFNYNLKPPANSMIFFPSNYIYAHTAHPVKEGTKYAIVNWMTENHG